VSIPDALSEEAPRASRAGPTEIPAPLCVVPCVALSRCPEKIPPGELGRLIDFASQYLACSKPTSIGTPRDPSHFLEIGVTARVGYPPRPAGGLGDAAQARSWNRSCARTEARMVGRSGGAESAFEHGFPGLS